MKILMMGLGSIGQRHVRNIRRVLGDKAEILAYRTRGSRICFTDKLEIREGVDLESEYNIKSYTDMDEALGAKPDAVFITNITSRHIECALKAAEAGCHIFMEKPLGDSLDGAEELQRLVKEKDLVFFMGFQNRYHPCIKKVKETLDKGDLGRVVYGECEFSERLTTMHRYEDYRGTYMARKDMGGGPVFNLLMHDLDIIRYLFGTPAKVSSLLSKVSDLEIDVEEAANGIFEWEGDKAFSFAVHTDFIQYPPVHRFKLVGEAGRIEADLNAACVKIYRGDEAVREEGFPAFQRNDMFIEELKDFMDCINGKRDKLIGFEAGLEALKMAVAMKKAAGSSIVVQ